MYYSVLPKQITAVNFVCHIADIVGDAVGHNDVCFFLEWEKIIYHSGAKEFSLLENWFIDNNLDTFGFDALHDALDAGGAEVVGTGLHDEAVDADD